MQVPAFNSFFSALPSSSKPSFSRWQNLSDHFVSASPGFHQSARLSLSSSTASTPADANGRFDGFRVFEQLLHKGYRQLQAGADFQPVAIGEPLTAEKAANTILGFIERRLQLDSDQGASQAALESRLEAGLEGFEKGFAEAREQLEAIGLLSESVAADIEDTHNRVLTGIDELREKYLNQSVAEADQRPHSGGDEPEAGAGTPTRIYHRAEYDYARRNTFSFELQTADGDTVKIRASAQETFAVAADHSGYGDGRQLTFSQSFAAQYTRASRFDLSVEGELDEGELAAIDDLLGQVNDLSERFFAGDLESAFNEALNLGYDSSEITRFALNLSRAEVARVSSAYQRDKAPERPAVPALADRLVPVGSFARDLLGAVEVAAQFGSSHELIRDLADRLAGLHGREQRFPDKHFGPFVSQLLG